MSSYHKYRPWGGPKFGSNTNWSKYEPVEPFPGACGDCSKAKEDHISEWTHEQKLNTLADIAENAVQQSKHLQELIENFRREIRDERR